MARSFIKHAWFSKKHEAQVGSLEMDTPDGKVVRITALADAQEAVYAWDDGAYIGVVLDGTFRNKAFVSDFNPTPTAPIRRQLAVGEVCTICFAEYKERFLFRSAYMGCHC